MFMNKKKSNGYRQKYKKSQQIKCMKRVTCTCKNCTYTRTRTRCRSKCPCWRPVISLKTDKVHDVVSDK